MKPDDSNRDPSREALARVARDSEVIGGSTMARQVRRLETHFAGGDAEPGADGRADPAEVWGRRVGRAISVLVFVALAFWLGVQLGWWSLP